MFSTLSNMLPNLTLGQDRDQQTPTPASVNPFDKLLAVKRRFDGARTTNPHEQEPAQHESPTEECEEPEQKAEKQRKRKPLNETFVVVRPPPSVSNHPLNLQLQLIPPNVQAQHQQRSASTSTTASGSSAGGERSYAAAGGVPNVPPISAGLQSRKEAQAQHADDEELTRVRSNRSDLSLIYSSVGSSASVQSFSTVASTSTSTGTRRIIPLYNLSAHNVLQNTVQDAGTDATVSRFRKRGIDIVGLGILEPVEVYGNMPLGGASGYGPEDASDAGHGSNAGHGRPGSFVSTSAVSGTESEYSPPKQTAHLRESSAPAYMDDSAPTTPKESAGKKIFGRFFKKKDVTPGTPTSGLLSPTIGTPRTSVTGSGPRHSMLVPPSPTPRERPASVHSAIASVHSSLIPPTPTTPQSAAGAYLQAPLLGTQAAVRAESYPPHGRPNAYVWVLRRWTKGGGVLAGLVGAGGVEVARMGVEVRFEWVRGKKRKRVVNGNGHNHEGSAGNGGRPVSVYSLAEADVTLGVPQVGDAASARSNSPAPAAVTRSRRGSEARSKRSTSPTKPRSQSPTKPRHTTESEDEDSDPEDSETPWTCTLRVLPVEPGDIAPPGSTNPMKLRLANLIPAPHHPKVIGQFKMPFPLPDISLSPKIELIPRLATDPFGINEGGEGMVMTAEEVKDVVCTTGLWLMVREGFGGLNGKKRKGDGWKIRS